MGRSASLLPQLEGAPPRDVVTRGVEPRAGHRAAAAVGNKVRVEGVVELAGGHAAAVLGGDVVHGGRSEVQGRSGGRVLELEGECTVGLGHSKYIYIYPGYKEAIAQFPSSDFA